MSLLKAPHFKHEEEGTSIIVDGRRVLMELNINLYPVVNMTLRTHDKPVPLEDILDCFRNDGSVSLHAIDTVLHVLNAVSLCLGAEIPSHRNEINDSELQLPVLGSRLAHVAFSNGNVDTKRLISSSCLLLVTVGTLCQNCVYANELHCNRASKRKRAEQTETDSNKRNKRDLNRSGLENKISVQKKQQRTTSSAKLITEDQLLTFAESDHNDLLRISEEIDKSRIPEDMQLLWDMQMKQLAAKSPKGHRWHPR